jgi:hypothetical protein
MNGWEWGSCPVEVYTKVKSSLVENFAHGWKNDMAANVATLFWRGLLRRSIFLGNLKASDKKVGLQRTLTWIKYYPSICCFQHFKVIFEGLGLVFKHFNMLQCIVSCSVLMTCLILIRAWLCFQRTQQMCLTIAKSKPRKKKIPSISILFYN